MKNKFVYRIRNKLNGKYFEGYSYFGTEGKQFSSEMTARDSLDYFVKSRTSRIDLKNKILTEAELVKIFPYQLEIIKTQVVYTDISTSILDTYVRNVFLQRRLQEKFHSFGGFWQNALKKGYADQIEYIVKLNIPKGTTRAAFITESRTQLRNLGIKTRTFREFQGMFGFYNKDQAFKARLTLDTSEFIDVTEIRKEIFA